jgi:hypothetical protein
MLACIMCGTEECDLPLGATSDAILDDLGLDYGADGFEELSEVASLRTLRDLLNEDGALVAIIFRDLGRRGLRAAGVASLTSMASTTAISGPIAGAVLVIAVAAGGTRAGTAAAAVVIATGIWTATAGTTTVAITRVATSVSIFICVSVFARSGTASISSPMVPLTASTPVSI